jgi:hypothetical protein
MARFDVGRLSGMQWATCLIYPISQERFISSPLRRSKAFERQHPDVKGFKGQIYWEIDPLRLLGKQIKAGGIVTSATDLECESRTALYLSGARKFGWSQTSGSSRQCNRFRGTSRCAWRCNDHSNVRKFLRSDETFWSNMTQKLR